MHPAFEVVPDAGIVIARDTDRTKMMMTARMMTTKLRELTSQRPFQAAGRMLHAVFFGGAAAAEACGGEAAFQRYFMLPTMYPYPRTVTI